MSTMWLVLMLSGSVFTFVMTVRSIFLWNEIDALEGKLPPTALVPTPTRAEVLERAAREVLASRGANAYRDGAPSDESLRELENALGEREGK